LDLGAIPCERLVDGVIDNFIDKVVEAAFAGRSDIHTWALADRLKAFEDGDRGGVVAALLLAHLASVGSFARGLKSPPVPD
jgi:hypothetical protein